MAAEESNVRVDSTSLFSLPSLQVAAHELKSPLALIRQLAQAISSGNNSAAEIEQLANRIGLTSERALRLTRDLTRTERLEPTLFEMEPLDPVSLCHDVINELTPLYRAKGRELAMARRQRTVPLVVANRDLLRRIMLNFADNALNYAETSRPVELSLQYRRELETVRLGVRDYGPGLASSVRASLEANTPDSRPSKLPYRPDSSGLGLFIAKQFAEAMQARVGATAHRDGASFYVDLERSTQLGLWS